MVVLCSVYNAEPFLRRQKKRRRRKMVRYTFALFRSNGQFFFFSTLSPVVYFFYRQRFLFFGCISIKQRITVSIVSKNWIHSHGEKISRTRGTGADSNRSFYQNTAECFERKKLFGCMIRGKSNSVVEENRNFKLNGKPYRITPLRYTNLDGSLKRG